MPKHIVRLILLFVGLRVVAVAARNFLVDKSFYEYGHYRGNAVAEIARDKPKFQGTAYCQVLPRRAIRRMVQRRPRQRRYRQGREMRGLPRPRRRPRSPTRLYQRGDRPGSPRQPEACRPDRHAGRSARFVTKRCRGGRCNRPRS